MEMYESGRVDVLFVIIIATLRSSLKVALLPSMANCTISCIMHHAAGAEVIVSGEFQRSSHTYKWIRACRILGRSFAMECDNVGFSTSS